MKYNFERHYIRNVILFAKKNSIIDIDGIIIKIRIRSKRFMEFFFLNNRNYDYIIFNNCYL